MPARKQRAECEAPDCRRRRSLRNVFCRECVSRVPVSVYAEIWRHDPASMAFADAVRAAVAAMECA